jgi:hypothetical protein
MEYSCSRYLSLQFFNNKFQNIVSLGLSNPDRNFVRVKTETVAFENRKWRILEQILIRQPDLCALEEIDIYDCFLEHHLPKYG